MEPRLAATHGAPSLLPAWGFAPSERLALSAAKRVAVSCCPHRDKPGGRRCARCSEACSCQLLPHRDEPGGRRCEVLRIAFLPKTLKLIPYSSPGLRRPCAGGATRWKASEVASVLRFSSSRHSMRNAHSSLNGFVTTVKPCSASSIRNHSIIDGGTVATGPDHVLERSSPI